MMDSILEGYPKSKKQFLVSETSCSDQLSETELYATVYSRGVLPSCQYLFLISHYGCFLRRRKLELRPMRTVRWSFQVLEISKKKEACSFKSA